MVSIWPKASITSGSVEFSALPTCDQYSPQLDTLALMRVMCAVQYGDRSFSVVVCYALAQCAVLYIDYL